MKLRSPRRPSSSRLKVVFLGLLVLVLALSAVVLVRALLVGDGPPRPEPAPAVEIDLRGSEDRLSLAIRHATITPSGPDADVSPFHELRDDIEEFFPHFHDVAERRLVNDLTLHFTIPGTDPGAPHVVFLAHQDVVPIEEGTLDDWSHPPFSGAIVDGFIWGRGTLDNKQNMMAMLEAADDWLATDARPRHTLHFVFGHDEEIGGMEGARRVAQDLERRNVEVLAVFDEGLVIAEGLVPGVDGPIALIGITERGTLNVQIEAQAPSGHASMPPQELAVVRLSEALIRIDDNPMAATLEGPTAMMLEHTIGEMSFGYRTLFANLWLFQPLVLSQMSAQPSTNAVIRTTAAPTMLLASPRANVLPQRAVANLNFRIHPDNSTADVIAHLENLLPEEYYRVLAVEEMRAEPSPLARMEGPGFDALLASLEAVFPGTPYAPNMLVAASDARHFTGLTNDVYRFQPIHLQAEDLGRIHGTDERIALESYHQLIRYYAHLLRHW